MIYKNFQPGDIVRDNRGFTFTVWFQNGCAVYPRYKPNDWRHPSNLTLVSAARSAARRA